MKLIKLFAAAVCIYFILELIFIPADINLTAGREQNIDLGLPLGARLTNESVEALSINNTPLTRGKAVAVARDFSLSSSDSGKARVQLSILGIPLKSVRLNISEPRRVIACGKAVGICVNSKGVLVLGTGSVNNGQGSTSPAAGSLQVGDMILSVNNRPVNTKEELISAVDEVLTCASLEIEREGESIRVDLTPVRDLQGSNKLGIWVRDGTQGIGTITYYDKHSGKFGALGHPITDVDTGKIMKISGGEVLSADILTVDKGKTGHPGALIGEPSFEEEIGSISDNNELGIYGSLFESGRSYSGGVEVAMGNSVDAHKGRAYILTEVDGEGVKPYAVNIDSINRYALSDTKAMSITVTDKRLIEKTGGIVQGMSGSPIIQDNKLVGAVTHVLVSNPQKGYACFAEDMSEYS